MLLRNVHLDVLCNLACSYKKTDVWLNTELHEHPFCWNSEMQMQFHNVGCMGHVPYNIVLQKTISLRHLTCGTTAVLTAQVIETTIYIIEICHCDIIFLS